MRADYELESQWYESADYAGEKSPQTTDAGSFVGRCECEPCRAFVVRVDRLNQGSPAPSVGHLFAVIIDSSREQGAETIRTATNGGSGFASPAGILEDHLRLAVLSLDNDLDAVTSRFRLSRYGFRNFVCGCALEILTESVDPNRVDVITTLQSAYEICQSILIREKHGPCPHQAIHPVVRARILPNCRIHALSRMAQPPKRPSSHRYSHRPNSPFLKTSRKRCIAQQHIRKAYECHLKD
ncbi:hypothetical protein [Pseudoclavibacter sp. 13-3]|uniref:hypothetical protein n=1 Tax=Pseudoclavibacter sp. 13-3 TaxID=2901228 RepID=UPI001E2F6B7E|nr:hypothetical protein [Pseudoclavibacter sp. 13-3]MCD7100473.1 hypothetical protein [Pseudoclavibacter sp. 13-3]